VYFICKQPLHRAIPSMIFIRCPMRASAERTVSGDTWAFRAMQIEQRAVPRITAVTASASVAMTATVRTGASGPVLDLGLRWLAFGHPRFITTHAACCTADHGVGADPKPSSLTIGSRRKLATHASISRRLTR
jgi:hypothetical protein